MSPVLDVCRERGVGTPDVEGRRSVQACQRGPFLCQRCRDGKLGGVARDEEVQAKWQGGSPAKVADLRTDIVCAAVPRCQEPQTAGLTYGRPERRRGGGPRG